LNQLFSFQAKPGYGTSGERGSGLGLMLCHEFAVQNGGQLQVKSNGSGSTFTVQLPEGRIKGFSLS
jgi:signal transduction histidine kinase